MNSMEICIFLENLRYGRRLSQEEFVEGIVSQRQYARYRNGECEITYEKLDQFASKLGIPAKKLLNEFEKTKTLQYLKVDRYYNAVVNRDTHEIKELENEIDKIVWLDEERKLYFQHAKILNEFLSGKTTKEFVISKTYSMINYPDILRQKYLTDIEILVLSFLLSVVGIEEQKTILRKLSTYFETEEGIMSGDNDFAHPLILMRMSKVYGLQKNYDRVLQFSEMGIQRGIITKSYYLMDYFYYFKSLAYFKLESYDLFEDSLFKCYNALQLEGNKKKIEKFTAFIEKDFHINFDGFIINYLKKRIL
jgi:transcriptional regulator with XRE-family HTH domain